MKYEDLYDSKTRLKELFDFYGSDVLGILKYDCVKNIEEKITYATVTRFIGNQQIILGEGAASLKIDAEQKAAAKAIESLKIKGFTKPVPEIYSLEKFKLKNQL